LSVIRVDQGFAMAFTDSPALRPAGRLARAAGGSIAYHKNGGRSPMVVFLSGLRSDMTGTKAAALDAFCRARGQAFLRFDYRGHGASSGRFEETVIGDWLDDTLAAIDQLAEGPLVLVGSSLGGWLMLLAAVARPERVRGLIGIAAAADFTEDLMWRKFSPDQRQRLLRDGRIEIPSAHAPEPTVVSRGLIEDGRKHLVLRAPIPFAGPVRLIHGLEDPDVPWQTALEIQRCLVSSDVEAILVKGGGHRLSEPDDLARLTSVVAQLLDRLA
jgi:pimeloyl-ACP methyl ester carboxylesterase